MTLPVYGKERNLHCASSIFIRCGCASWLSDYRDNRGKPRKDFRDFVGLRPHNEDFRNLLTLAMPARFWTKNWSERSKKESYDINTAYLHYFLTLNGFYTLKDETTDDVRYIRMNDCIVRQVNAKDISAFLKGLYDRTLPSGGYS